MKKLLVILFLLCSVATVVVIGCKRDSSMANLTPLDEHITFSVPRGWPQPVYNFSNNPLTQSGFELGRRIFYDTRLSKDSTVSCATCHQQFAGFSNLDHPLSHGVYGLFGVRNAPGLFNDAWQKTFFWDGGVVNIENQPINPMQNPVEMGETLQDVINKISSDATYPGMFKNAFGDPTVNSQRIFKALALFMVSMVSDNSRYDKYMRGDADGSLTTQELHGLQVFRDKCASCHKEPLFTDLSYRNNGLTVNPSLNDSGRFRITLDPDDWHKFKVPSLRNVALTAPYMHDGRFTTLDAVVEHYRTGIYQSPTLDTALTNGISMTDSDKADVISFLQTLTDTSFVHDSRFAQPQQ